MTAQLYITGANPDVQRLLIRPQQPPIAKMNTLKDLATNPEHMRWMFPLLMIADAALCGVIIETVPCMLTAAPNDLTAGAT